MRVNMSPSTPAIALQDGFGQGLLQKIPRHLFLSGSAKQLHVAANVGEKAAIYQQKPSFCGLKPYSVQEHTLAVKGSCRWGMLHYYVGKYSEYRHFFERNDQSFLIDMEKKNTNLEVSTGWPKQRCTQILYVRIYKILEENVCLDSSGCFHVCVFVYLSLFVSL